MMQAHSVQYRYDTSAAGGLGIAKGLIEDIPVAGQAIAIGATALDLVGTGLEVAKCYQ
jgi:hypothetical protein